VWRREIKIAKRGTKGRTKFALGTKKKSLRSQKNGLGGGDR